MNTPDIAKTIDKLETLATRVPGWGRCDQAWLDTSEDTPCAVFGHIDENGETYPVATVDCDQYEAGGDSLPLAQFYAAVNTETILAMIKHMRAQEAELSALRAYRQEVEAAELHRIADMPTFPVTSIGAAPVSVPQWQPIETAPHGVLVIATDGDITAPTVHDGDVWNFWEGEFYTQDDGVLYGEMNSWLVGCEPTHWMPLPDAPSPTEKES